MKFFYLLLASLATFRLALMISSEDGPARIFRKLRNIPPAKSNAKEGISCPWCVSVWVSALSTTYLWYLGIFLGPEWPLWWMGVSAGAIALNQELIAKVK